MADELKLSITLDTKNVEQGFQKIEKSSQDASKSIKENLDGSSESFASELTDIAGRFAGVAAAAAAAGVALKSAFDFALLGEATRAVELRFDALAKSAGLAAEQLREGVIAATQGLIDDEDALEIATRGIVAFGKEAERIPQILNASRLASRALGLDLRTSFESFSNFVQTGSERLLRQFGLVVDLDRAYKDFATSIGTTADQLTEQERQTVRINLLLEQTAERYAGVEQSVTPLRESLDILLVSIGNLTEDLAAKFNNTFGPAIQNVINKFNDLVQNGISLRDFLFLLVSPSGFLTNVAKGFDNSALSVDQLNTKIAQTTQEIQVLEAQLASAQKRLSVTQAGDVSGLASNRLTISALTKDLLKAKKELTEFQDLLTKRAVLPPPPIPPTSARGLKDETKDPQALTQFLKDQEIQRAQNAVEAAKFRLDNETNLENLKDLNDKLRSAETVLAVKEFEKQKLDLVEQFSGAKQLKQEEFNKAELALERTHQSNLDLIFQQADQREGEINARREAETEKLKKSLQEVEAQAKKSIGFAFANAIGQAVNALARGEDGIDAFLKSALGGIADLAIQYGSLFILQGAGFELIPGLQASGAGLVASGLGLLALGGLLKALSAGEAETSAAPGTSGGGGGIAPTPGPGTELVPPEELRQAEQTQVQVIVEGSIFDSDGTSTRIIELINEAFDKKGVVIQRGAFA
jgi:hypothetical protein